MTAKSRTRRGRLRAAVFLAVAAVLVSTSVILSLWYLLGVRWPKAMTGNTADTGIFGDQFGAVNALFSGLALAGVVLSLWLQRAELRRAIETSNRSVKATVTLDVLNDLRADDWGDAHRFIRKWYNQSHASRGDTWGDEYRRVRGLDDDERADEDRQLDRERRVFTRPLHKLYALWLQQVIELDDARHAISPKAQATIRDIVLDLEKIRAEEYEKAVGHHPTSKGGQIENQYLRFLHDLVQEPTSP